MDLLRVVLEFNAHLNLFTSYSRTNTTLDPLRVVSKPHTDNGPVGQSRNRSSSRHTAYEEEDRLPTSSRPIGSFRNLTQTMTPSGDFGIDQDRGTQHMKRKVVYRPPRDPSGRSETSHRQWPRRAISESIMIAAPFPGPSETYGAPATLGFTLHPILPELMSVSTRVGSYFRLFLESI